MIDTDYLDYPCQEMGIYAPLDPSVRLAHKNVVKIHIVLQDCLTLVLLVTTLHKRDLHPVMSVLLVHLARFVHISQLVFMIVLKVHTVLVQLPVRLI